MKDSNVTKTIKHFGLKIKTKSKMSAKMNTAPKYPLQGDGDDHFYTCPVRFDSVTPLVTRVFMRACRTAFAGNARSITALKPL